MVVVLRVVARAATLAGAANAMFRENGLVANIDEDFSGASLVAS